MMSHPQGISALVGELLQKNNEVAEQERENEKEELVLNLEKQITSTDSTIKLKRSLRVKLCNVKLK